MADDQKLVELMARALCKSMTYGQPWESLRASEMLQLIGHARAAIAAINASGTHWVAPVVLTDAMYEASDEASESLPDFRYCDLEDIWDLARTAYLAKTETDT